jgi:MFS family permease
MLPLPATKAVGREHPVTLQQVTPAVRTGDSVIRSLVPARMDRLPWTRFHWNVALALGITWILDGVEIGLASAIGDVLRREDTLGFTAQTVGISASAYLFGEVVGALLFGRLADRLGRRRLFIVTLALYLVANGLTALSFTTEYFLVTRFFAGMGIGGEYAAIHSAIDELTPARYRGRVDIAIAGTYWAGAMLAAGAQIFLLDPTRLPINLGWRIGLALGPLIGLSIWSLRKHIPESPRWLLVHGHAQQAEATVDRIEAEIRAKGLKLDPVDSSLATTVHQRENASYRAIAKVLLKRYRNRSVLGATLMITQSFLYNAVFFTYAIILVDYYAIRSETVPYFIFPFALGNLLGPLTIGRLFDTIGRRKMIASTYVVSGSLLAVSGWLFQANLLTAVTQTLFWCVIFFVASAAASSAYLTVSEIFPLEMRAQAIALFFSVAQLVGGVVAPALFGALIATRSRTNLAIGYYLGAALMVLGGVVAAWLGVDAENRGLEALAPSETALEAVRSSHASE